MNSKEREQLIVFNELKKEGISQKEAANRLKVSDCWVRKKFRRFIGEGAAGLPHKNRGVPSKKCWNKEDQSIAIELLKTDWQGFGPTFAAEKLQELKGITVSKETMRKAMIQEGIWRPKQRRSLQRKRRERRQMTGHLVQLDGSPHDWFEGRAEKCTLLVFIDDATSKLLWLAFVKSESCIDVLQATKNYVTNNGRPHAFYVDFGSVFSVNTNNPERDKKKPMGAGYEISFNRSHSCP